MYCVHVSALLCIMGPPGGGCSDITGHFTCHMQVVSIDKFDNFTMTSIFIAITDWHFAKGFDVSFMRMGKASQIYATLSFKAVSKKA